MVQPKTRQAIAALAANADDHVLLTYQGLRRGSDLLKALPQDDHHAKLLADYFAAAAKNSNTKPTSSEKAAREAAVLASKRAVVQALAKAFAEESLR